MLLKFFFLRSNRVKFLDALSPLFPSHIPFYKQQLGKLYKDLSFVSININDDVDVFLHMSPNISYAPHMIYCLHGIMLNPQWSLAFVHPFSQLIYLAL